MLHLRASRSAVSRKNAFFPFFLCVAGGLASRDRMGRQDCLSVTLPRFFEGWGVGGKGIFCKTPPFLHGKQTVMRRRIRQAEGKAEAGQGVRTTALFLCAAGGLASRGRMGRQDCLPETLPRFFEG